MLDQAKALAVWVRRYPEIGYRVAEARLGEVPTANGEPLIFGVLAEALRQDAAT